MPVNPPSRGLVGATLTRGVSGGGGHGGGLNGAVAMVDSSLPVSSFQTWFDPVLVVVVSAMLLQLATWAHNLP